LAVGDLHVENFGTWRDSEGRLVWGVNDFDEAARMPYTLDLVRLVTSALLAKREGRLSLGAEEMATAVLEGYTGSLDMGGSPFVLEEEHPSLRTMAMAFEREPSRFWSKLAKLPSTKPPKSVLRLLERSLPKGSEGLMFAHRIAGVGSLGRPRFVAIAVCNGGFVAREAKAWLPSAWKWAEGKPKDRPYSIRLLKNAVCQPDPYYGVKDGWVMRRLGPHCGRIELAKLLNQSDERHLLKAMGHETANLHLGTSGQHSKIKRDLQKRKSHWLLSAAEVMAKTTDEAQKAFSASLLSKADLSAR
jgi:hypothetical protein